MARPYALDAVTFAATPQEMDLIRIAAMRAADSGVTTSSVLETRMDLEATHCNGCPLDLKKLLAFDEFNFAHDIAGIARHLDRKTGKLGDCFSPRCSLPPLPPKE